MPIKTQSSNISSRRLQASAKLAFSSTLCMYVLYFHIWLRYMILLNYNLTFTCVFMCNATRKLQCIPVTCLHGPCFLVVWNMHISCNLLCTMCRIATHGVATCVTATQGTCLGKYLTMP